MPSFAELSPGDNAPSAIVLDKDGQPVELADLWHSGPLFLTFLRHFG